MIDESYMTAESSTTDLENENFNKNLQKGKNKINFNISFSKEEWLKIKPQEKMRKESFVNFRLQRRWTDAFVQKIWNKYKIPCAYCFSEEKVYKEIKKWYIKIRGYCKKYKKPIIWRMFKISYK